MPDWRRTSVFVEIHEHSEIAWRAIETKLDALRRRYAEAGGRPLTVATLRDPERQLQSLYRQQPPAAALAASAFRPLVPEAGRAVNGSSTFDDDFRKTTFEDWLHFNGGFTTRTLGMRLGRPAAVLTTALVCVCVLGVGARALRGRYGLIRT